VNYFDEASLDKALQANNETFLDLVSNAEYLLSRRGLEAAAIYCQMAAQFAWSNHPGFFASPRLERLLSLIGQTLDDAHRSRDRSDESSQHVLHVLTEAYPLGGHTRLCARWIEQDSERIHSVVLTGQRHLDVPQFVSDAVSATGGRLHLLDENPASLIKRSRLLKKLAVTAGQIVLHTHPHDVVPSIAFSRRSFPIILLNHADHVFWIGTAIADVVAHLRGSAALLSCKRRGIDFDRCNMLPIPLPSRARTVDRASAKSQLGLDSNTVVLLSIATAYKFGGPGTASFLNLLAPIVDAHPHVRLVAVGPSDEGEWRRARDVSGGTIRAYGQIEDPSLFYQAADVYVDSFPFASLTSLLEAASYGLPIVSYCLYPPDAFVLSADDPALIDSGAIKTDEESFRVDLRKLIADSTLRRQAGEQAMSATRHWHMSPGWRNSVNNLYLKTEKISILKEIPSVSNDSNDSSVDRAVLWMHKAGRLHIDLLSIYSQACRLLPLPERISLWRQLRLATGKHQLKMLVPAAIGRNNQRRLKKLAQWLQPRKNTMIVAQKNRSHCA
jgi:glycosyltransferase involved in cell wall biosynthesis